ncbi:alpha/beta hydrolase-fold protein [Calycomorphotria hydatis]|uniref:Carbohydrate acetyl esterase/feruloyl esterase n=1 Tax=Calycomorphotria hydatis TaxID=2528027 RepID=A0A517TDH8_9PLAN|nr:alpha/beta hydrolase-fold protein [Calycomorphotria hydatis]QDT66419.1 Carbohydrate acetyl esterase/feruloyl esterase precursor [Calycomorphotria hydatis]
MKLTVIRMLPLPMLLLLSVLCLMSVPAIAEEASPKNLVAFHRGSYELNGDGSVTFRLKAPKAESVQVTGKVVGGRKAMEKAEDGTWSWTLEAAKPGIYSYSFVIDGVRVADPLNPQRKPSLVPQTSILHIPGDNSFDFKDVPHGTVHYHGYHSPGINRFREAYVYTPPGYETSEETYPLLVLQHGRSDNAAVWTKFGKAHWILDNLIASGKAKPMIILMLDGHPLPESFGDGRPFDATVVANAKELHTDMMGTALPMVEKLYRVKSGRENRALAGLSMGGYHTLFIGLNELETFSALGVFSGAPPAREYIEEALNNPKATNDRLNLFWIACGEKDFLLQRNEDLLKLLDEAGIQHEWHLTEGDHSWPVWRGYLTQFAPRLFQEN